uniref:Heparan sulfate glucosamine 3-O-sulfotransferase 3A1 n=1 Tax=Aceria tosichella TaxID=561515 RepID=A0A6G1SBR8_9ACAR
MRKRMLELRKPKELYLLGTALALSTLLLLVTIQTHMMNSMLTTTSPLDESNDERSHESDGGKLGVISSNETLPVETGQSSIRKRHLPQAIIIGTRKSGTRALAKFLEINPSIRSAHNEVHFFDRMKNYKLGLEWYRNQMPLTSENQLTIEKSPAYFVTNNVPERIKAMNASIKLIVIMRDPVTRLISDFSQLIANRLKDYYSNDYEREDWELVGVDMESSSEASPITITSGNTTNTAAAIEAAQRELEEHVLRVDGGIDEQRRIVRTGMYSMHLERWMSVFPRGQFHFVDGERLVREPHAELQKLELFLGFKEPMIRREHFIFSPKKGFYCLADRSLTRDKRQTYTTTRMIDNDELVVKPICLGKSKGRRHVSISKELSDKLKSFYAPYNEYLLSLTGLNFT